MKESCCAHTNTTCPALIPDLHSSILRQQVANLELDVDILWMGHELDAVVTQRTSQHSPTLFFNWVPNHLTAFGNFTRVNFPLCRSSYARPVNCDFEVHQLSKIAWVGLERHAPYVHHLLQKLSFSQMQYEDLLRMYVDNGELTYRDAACMWLKENKRMWKDWIPSNLSNKTYIYLGGMIPLSGRYVRQRGVVPGECFYSTHTLNMMCLSVIRVKVRIKFSSEFEICF